MVIGIPQDKKKDEKPTFDEEELKKKRTEYAITGANATDEMTVWNGENKQGKAYTLTVKEYAQIYSVALLNPNDKRHEDAVDIFNSLRPSGVFGEEITEKSIYSGFRRIAISAANTYRGGKGQKIDPISNYTRALQTINKFQQTNSQQQSLDFQGFTDKEASTMAWNAYKSAFGRAPSKDEVKSYKAALVAAAQAAPAITTKRVVDGQVSYEKAGGFDVKTWSAGYMSALLPKEKNQADLSGNAGVLQDALRTSANAYGVQLDPVDSLNRVRALMDGSLTQDQLTAQLQGMAKAKYGQGMAAAIDNGNTVAQVVQPMRKQYSDLMGVNEDSVSIADVAGMALTDDKQGLLTEGEFVSKVRAKPEWLKTDSAKQEAYDLGTSVLRMFGLVK